MKKERKFGLKEFPRPLCERNGGIYLMADIKSPEDRSLNMSKIRSKDTKPEVWFRKRLFNRGYRYRKNTNVLPGHPDLWFSRYNTALFIHGCFWHRHSGCKFAYTPKSRTEFWISKFQKNTERDSFVMQQLEQQNVRIIVIWECTIKNMMKTSFYEEEVLSSVVRFLHSDIKYLELYKLRS